MHADDTSLYTSDKIFEKLAEKSNKELDRVDDCLIAHRLTLNKCFKTDFIIFYTSDYIILYIDFIHLSYKTHMKH